MKSEVHVIGLQKVAHGFTGCIETMRKFVRAGFFQSPLTAVAGISAEALQQTLSLKMP